MTHSHGSFAFESALIDAEMRLAEGDESVLVGGIDECPNILTEIEGAAHIDMAEGVTFLRVSKKYHSPSFIFP